MACSEPVDITVTSSDATVFEFGRVQPGVECATVLELVAGDYTVTFGDSAKTFTVTAAGQCARGDALISWCACPYHEP